MPRKMPKPCAHPGCPNLTHDRFCSDHAKQERKRYDRERGTAAQRGYGSRWRKYRKWFLTQNPLCVKCKEEGKLTPATDVDHIQAVKGPNDPLFWEPSNHQALCHSCHSRKTVKENGGWG